jgi:two-component system, chemotaxis family, chemotaxis protein CheY
VDPSVPRRPTVAAGARLAVPKRILVIDDEPAVRRLLTDLLDGEGYVVSEAPDGIRGLDRAQHVSPDLIIVDLMMPVMNGWAFAEACRRRDICCDVPIIAISAMFDLKSAAATLDPLGVRAYLPKPFDVDMLLSLVAQLA